MDVIDGLERVVPSEVLEPFSEGFADTAELDMFESREGGGGSGWSGNVGASGDCSLEEGTETTTGEDTEVPAGLLLRAGFVVALFFGAAPMAAPSSSCSMPWSLLTPTEALRRLYRPLRPLCTMSKLLTSFVVDAGGGEVRSSKVVKASERDAVACIWWSELGKPRESRESRAMVVGGRLGIAGGSGTIERRGAAVSGERHQVWSA